MYAAAAPAVVPRSPPRRTDVRRIGVRQSQMVERLWPHRVPPFAPWNGPPRWEG